MFCISTVINAQHVRSAQALQDEGLGAGKSISEDELKHRKSSAVRAWMVSLALQKNSFVVPVLETPSVVTGDTDWP